MDAEIRKIVGNMKINSQDYIKSKSGKTTKLVCWRIIENALEKVTNSIFYNNESYFYAWTYITNNTKETIQCYFHWKGINAPRGFSPLPPDLDDVPIERISQWAEPPIFLNIFKGKFLVFSQFETKYRLCILRGLGDEVHAFQVPCKKSSLRSKSTFLLVDLEGKNLMVWHGSHSGNREYACNFLEKFTRIELEEGLENDDFLKILDGDLEDYFTLRNIPTKKSALRLFYFNKITGEFQSTEVVSFHNNFPFLQSHLYTAIQPALFLLDDSDELWIWQGWQRENNENFSLEYEKVLNIVKVYSETKKQQNVVIKLIFAGLEPLAFTNLFPFWEKVQEVTEIQLKDGLEESLAIAI